MARTGSRDLIKEMHREMAAGTLINRALEHGLSYMRDVSARNVAPSMEALDGLDKFQEPFPQQSGNAMGIIDLLHQAGSPGTMAQTGGRFFGLVNGGAIPTGLAARLLADIWDQNAVLHAVSPTSAVLEEVCERWLCEIFGLPEGTVAGFVSGTSLATVSCLAAARWRICQRASHDVNAQGLASAPEIRIVTGRHAHSTVVKAVAMLGFGTSTIEWVDVDNQGRLLAESLPSLDDRTILILQAGNVNSGSFDPLRNACEKASAAGAWVHVDGAFGLWAAVSSRFCHLTDGMELAQSWSVDGHKTLNTPYDCGISLCADKEAMTTALQNSGAYIMYSDHRDSMVFTPEMSRRARGVELWATLKYLGQEGLVSLLDQLHERALQFATELDEAGFEIVNEVVFNQVLVRAGDQQKTNQLLMHIQQSGEAWVGSSSWFDEAVIRISVCSWATTSGDVTRAVEAFVSARKAVSA